VTLDFLVILYEVIGFWVFCEIVRKPWPLREGSNFAPNSNNTVSAARHCQTFELDETNKDAEPMKIANGDGVTDAGELQSLNQLGIASISLNGQAVNGTTPQGTEIRTYSTFTRTDGTTSGVYDAVFGNDQTNTVYRGESGQAAWAGAAAIDVKGFGRITNLAVATANDFDLAELVASRSAAMTNPDLHTLAVQAGDVLGAWGASLNLSRELTPVLTSADGKTLLDRAIYVEDGVGGYYTLKSGAAVLDVMNSTVNENQFLTEVA
jgi:hypothetical protein